MIDRHGDLVYNYAKVLSVHTFFCSHLLRRTQAHAGAVRAIGAAAGVNRRCEQKKV